MEPTLLISRPWKNNKICYLKNLFRNHFRIKILWLNHISAKNVNKRGLPFWHVWISTHYPAGQCFLHKPQETLKQTEGKTKQKLGNYMLQHPFSPLPDPGEEYILTNSSYHRSLTTKGKDRTSPVNCLSSTRGTFESVRLLDLAFWERSDVLCSSSTQKAKWSFFTVFNKCQ